MNTETHQKFEVLIAALNGSINIYNEANLHCSCVIANQTDTMSFYREGMIKFVCTNTRGVGKNRNISLLFSDAQYILFGDDDVKYVDDLEAIVVDSFVRHPQADVLIFNIETVGSDLVRRRMNKKCRRVTIKNYMNYGAVRIACRRNAIIKKGIYFSEEFGGGAKFGSGEDTKFLADCLKNNLKIYTIPIKIGVVDQSTSSWFNGFNDKYFTDKGALMKSIYPKAYRLFCLYFAFKMRSKERGFCKVYSLMVKGAKIYEQDAHK